MRSTRLHSCVDVVIRVDRQVAPAHELLQVVQQVHREEDGACPADDHPEDVVLDEAPEQDAQHQHKAARPQEATCACQRMLIMRGPPADRVAPVRLTFFQECKPICKVQQDANFMQIPAPVACGWAYGSPSVCLRSRGLHQADVG